MPYKTWVVGEEVLAADFNTMVQRQVVATFANAAGRTSGLTAPQAGQLTYLVDVGRYEYWTGTAWKSLTGVLALAETTTSQSGIGTVATDLAGLNTGPVAVPAGRRIEVATSVTFTKAAPDQASFLSMSIEDGTAQIQSAFQSIPAPGWAHMNISRILTPAAGTYTWRARAVTGAGFLNTQVATNAPGWIRVTDLGSG